MLNREPIRTWGDFLSWHREHPPLGAVPLTLAQRMAHAMQAERDEKRADARDVRRELEQEKTHAAGALATGRMEDKELRQLAQRRAWLMQQRIDGIATAMHETAMLAWLNGQVQALQGKPFAWAGDRPNADQLRGFINRARCHLWWRRCLRRAAVLLRETEANIAGEVSATRRQPYVTHDTAARHAARRAANAALLEATHLENEDAQVMSLQELADKSPSNKAIRRGELMTRIRGCERWAEAFKFRGVFLTLTAPSRFHRVHRHGELNARHDGSTPRDAQQWLCAAWARARAKLQRQGVAVFGFRVAEPHHDGCPHWHALLWALPGQLWRAVRVIKRAWLKLEGAESGARQYRAKAMLMRPGGASGYIAKYVAKNIDDHGAVGAEGHTDDAGLVQSDRAAADRPPNGECERHGNSRTAGAGGWSDAEAGTAAVGDSPARYGLQDKQLPQQQELFGGTAKRVEAWASAWGIRQFQPIGQPPVTVWRELRRIKEPGGATARMARALDAVNREGAERADWALYVLEQGGMLKGRNYLLRIATLRRLKHGRYESIEKDMPIGVIDTTADVGVQGSGRKEWRPRGAWTEADRIGGIWAPRVSPWTRFNNCTRAPGLEVWTERIKREPWGGCEPERHSPCPTKAPPEPPEPSPTNSRLSTTLRLVRSFRSAQTGSSN